MGLLQIYYYVKLFAAVAWVSQQVQVRVLIAKVLSRRLFRVAPWGAYCASVLAPYLCGPRFEKV